MTVLCGYGNNGGDGYIVARLAKADGWPVRLLQVGDANKLTGDATKARDMWLECGGQVELAGQPIDPGTLIVDAMLGTGLSGPVRTPFVELIEQVNRTANLGVCAVDVPSGLGADTGQPFGPTIVADMTCTFVAVKQGLTTGQGADYCGKLHFAGLGIGDAFECQVEPTARVIDYDWVWQRLGKRKRSSHKGNFGHVVLIGGNQGMSGAIRMAAKACLRTGAGLVTVLTHKRSELLIAANCPEIMVRGIDADEDISLWLNMANIIVFGPGAGLDDWSETLLPKVMACPQPKVVDADGLNLLAKSSLTTTNAVLTPHPKEAARLLETSVSDVQEDRFAAARRLAEKHNAVCLLKGYGTVICEGHRQHINPTGNPGMATAGMGDILSGIIAGLLAQGLSPGDAAVAGAWLHGRAGDLGAAEGERGMLATDVLPYLRKLVNRD